MKKKIFPVVLTVLISILFSSFQPAFAYSGSKVLKVGAQGSEVSRLQQDLKKLGMLNQNPTGYFGETTKEAVMKLQRKYKLTPDGTAGSGTFALIDKLLKRKSEVPKTKIVIDPGHGGFDTGTLMGLESESKMTLDISKKLKSMLDASYNVIMTRSGNVSPYLQSKLKDTRVRRDLNARTNIANQSGAKLFVSIHINSIPTRPDLSGSVVYYNDKLPESKVLAQSIQQELNSIKANGKDRRANRIEEANYYVLKNTNIPGVLVETAFVTNKQERQLLATKDFRMNLAEAIKKGIDNYVK